MLRAPAKALGIGLFSLALLSLLLEDLTQRENKPKTYYLYQKTIIATCPNSKL